MSLPDFVTGLRLDDVPDATRRRLELLLADLAAVCVGGRPAPASRIAVEYDDAWRHEALAVLRTLS